MNDCSLYIMGGTVNRVWKKKVVHTQKREGLPLFMPPNVRGLLTNPLLALP